MTAASIDLARHATQQRPRWRSAWLPFCAEAPDSSLDDVTAGTRHRLAAWSRRVFLLVIFGFVVAGLCGVLGVRAATTSASADGYRLSLHYPRIARAGLDVPWQVTVTHPGGFSGPVVVEASGAYFDIFESQGISPEPSQETRDGTWWRLSFDPPSGDTLVISLDVYVQPSSQRGRSGTVRVLDKGSIAASVDFKTSLLP